MRTYILNEENPFFQFWPEVTELVIAQLMYLESKDPDEPMTLYIDSSGSKTEDGETVSLLSIFSNFASFCLDS